MANNSNLRKADKVEFDEYYTEYEYIQKERDLYFDINQLPFIKSSSNNDLLSAISTFDEKKYLSELTAFNNSIGSYENGNACKKITEYINQECNK